MRKYLAIIIPLAIMAPLILIVLLGLLFPKMANETPKPDPYAGYAPIVQESYRNDAQSHREWEAKKKEQERKDQILKRAYEECREQKISDAAVVECVRRKVL